MQVQVVGEHTRMTRRWMQGNTSYTFRLIDNVYEAFIWKGTRCGLHVQVARIRVVQVGSCLGTHCTHVQLVGERVVHVQLVGERVVRTCTCTTCSLTYGRVVLVLCVSCVKKPVFVA